MSAPDQFVSVREFARLDGCDESLVRRAVKSKKLAISADGKIDRALVGTGWRRQNRRGGEGSDSPAPVRKSVRARKKSAPADIALADVAESLADAAREIAGEEAADFLTEVLAGRFSEIGHAERIKENALAAKHLIAARKEAGSLVEVDRAEAIFFEAARAERDAWISFPTRIGPLLAADLEIDTDRLVEALTIHVQQQLEQLGEPEADFTASD